MKAYVPASTVEGYYRGEGRFNGVKIKSKGYFNVTASKLNCEIKIFDYEMKKLSGAPLIN